MLEAVVPVAPSLRAAQEADLSKGRGTVNEISIPFNMDTIIVYDCLSVHNLASCHTHAHTHTHTHTHVMTDALLVKVVLVAQERDRQVATLVPCGGSTQEMTHLESKCKRQFK